MSIGEEAGKFAKGAGPLWAVVALTLGVLVYVVINESKVSAAAFNAHVKKADAWRADHQAGNHASAASSVEVRAIASLSLAIATLQEAVNGMQKSSDKMDSRIESLREQVADNQKEIIRLLRK